MKPSRLLGGLLLSLFALWGCPEQQVAPPANLKVAMDPQIGMPFVYKIGEDQYGGFEVDIAKYLAQKLDKEIQIVETAWNQLPEAVHKKKVDLALNAIEKPIDNAVPEDLAYTAHYYTAFQQLTVHNEDNFTYNLSDLKGKKVGVVEASVGALLLIELNRLKEANIEIMTYTTPEEVMQALLKKQITAALTERAVASWYSWKNKELRLTGEPISSEIPYVGLIRADRSDLLKDINRILQSAGQDPEFRAIFDKWHVSIRR